MATVEQSQKLSPPYVPFPTFKNFILSLKAGIPARIDKSVMATLSGGAQSQLLVALRYFELIKANLEPEAELAALVNACDTPDWADTLAGAIKSSYGDVLGTIDLNSATPHQLDEAFRATGLEGSTVEKAVRFFLNAVQEAKMPHGKRLVQRKPRTAKRPRQRAANGGAAPAPEAASSAKVEPQLPPDMMEVPIHFKGKAAGKIVVPKSVTAADCKMLKIAVQMVEAYAAAADDESAEQ